MNEKTLPRPPAAAFVELRDLLVELFADEQTARMVLRDAGMSVGNNSFQTEPVVTWQNVLEYAYARSQISDLVNAASHIYERHASTLYSLASEINATLPLSRLRDMVVDRWPTLSRATVEFASKHQLALPPSDSSTDRHRYVQALLESALKKNELRHLLSEWCLQLPSWDERAEVVNLVARILARERLSCDRPTEQDVLAAPNPLLCEWDFLRRDHVPRERPYRFRALLFVWLTFSLLSVVLGRLADANCMSFDVFVAKKYVSSVWFGYLAEFNHAIYNVFFVPLFLVLGLTTLREAGRSLNHLTVRGLLVSPQLQRAGVPTQTLIRRWNRRLSVLSVLAVTLSMGVVLSTEVHAYSRGLGFGWVQAPFVSQNPSLWRDLADVQAVNSLPHIEGSCKKNAGDDCEVKNVRGNASQRLSVFWIFVTVAMLVQVAFIGFGLYVVFKIFFIIVLLAISLRGITERAKMFDVWHPFAVRNNAGAPFELWLELFAEDERFGLRVLDGVYNRVLGMSMLSAIGAVLSRFSNGVKGNYIDPSLLNYGDLGQVLLIVGVCCATSAVLFLPAWLFFRMTAQAKATAVADWQQRSSIAGSAGDEKAARYAASRLEQLKKQTPYPRRDMAFGALLVVIFTLLAFVGASVVRIGLVPELWGAFHRAQSLVCGTPLGRPQPR